eukprot:TRINITY_DN3705_c0_g1_i1.p1 TRINITY_DN3705_c0_g1~~TRINITY_DN3705_c0_g1_i1.p1  ORF type:complete len:183 (+),score=37.26 TRINITY_DN3705_c0_g1_i1:32-550(+)
MERSSRGGRSDFDWNVLMGDKNAANQEYYLGRSEKCEDLWYKTARPSKLPIGSRVDATSAKAELLAIKKHEEDMMKAALGLKTSSAADVQNMLAQLQGAPGAPPAKRRKKEPKDVVTALLEKDKVDTKQKKKSKKSKKSKKKKDKKKKRSKTSSASSSSSSSASEKDQPKAA